jgi:hypothetical protein
VGYTAKAANGNLVLGESAGLLWLEEAVGLLVAEQTRLNLHVGTVIV